MHCFNLDHKSCRKLTIQCIKGWKMNEVAWSRASDSTPISARNFVHRLWEVCIVHSVLYTLLYCTVYNLPLQMRKKRLFPLAPPHPPWNDYLDIKGSSSGDGDFFRASFSWLVKSLFFLLCIKHAIIIINYHHVQLCKSNNNGKILFCEIKLIKQYAYTILLIARQCNAVFEPER